MEELVDDIGIYHSWVDWGEEGGGGFGVDWFYLVFWMVERVTAIFLAWSGVAVLFGGVQGVL